MMEPMPRPAVTMPIIMPRLSVNHLATVDTAAGKSPPAPTANKTP